MRKAAKRASEATKSAAIPEAAKYPRKAVHVKAGETEIETARICTALATSPDVAAYRVINAADAKTVIGEVIDIPILMKQLRDQAAAVNRGDLAQPEAMLMNQATALQSLFVRLIEKGMAQDQLLQYETHMRLALKAQNQCRMTLETLATIKNPSIVYARQANVTTGPQQINNGMAAPSRAREIESGQTQLLDANDGKQLDRLTAGTAIGSDPAMATLGKLDGAEVGRG